MQGLLDLYGKVIIPPVYHSIEQPSRGRLLAQNGDTSYTYIDLNQKKLTSRAYHKAYGFSPDYPMAIVGRKTNSDTYLYSIIDLNFNKVGCDEYIELSHPYCGIMAASINGETYGYIKPNGATLLPFVYRKVCEFSCGLAAVSMAIEEQVFYINEMGSVVLGPYDGKIDFDICFSDCGIAKLPDLNRPFDDFGTKYIDTRGDVVISLDRNTRGGLFRSNYANVYRRDSKLIGAMGIDGQTVIDFRYKSPFTFYDGFANVVDEHDNVRIINAVGDILQTPRGTYPNGTPSCGRIVVVSIDTKKFGASDCFGNLVIDTKYEYIGGFYSGYAVFEP